MRRVDRLSRENGYGSIASLWGQGTDAGITLGALQHANVITNEARIGPRRSSHCQVMETLYTPNHILRIRKPQQRHETKKMTDSRHTGTTNGVHADFADSSTACLNAPRRAVNCSFSLPPVDNRCLWGCAITISMDDMRGTQNRARTPWSRGSLEGICAHGA